MKKTILLVSHDKKTISQISRWLNELPEDVVVETAASLEELTIQLTRAESEGEIPADSILRLLIFDVTMFGAGDPLAFISQTRDKFQKSKWCSIESPLKVMILSFDKAYMPLKAFISPDVDDLLMKPLDHQLFLQKTGMMLADKSKSAGNFLFKQKANFVIEMAKEVRIVKMSEFGVVVSNPSPLAPGVFAHLYSNVFGDKGKSSVWAKVFSTRRDPKNPGHYLCFFSFFGIKSEQLMFYRKKLRERRKELKFFETGVDKDQIPAAIRHVAIIDRNPTDATLIAETLAQNYLNLKTYSYSSYTQFLKAVSGSAVSTLATGEELPEGIEPSSALNGEQLSIIISSDRADLLRTEPEIRPNSQFCGVNLEDLEGTNKWLDLLVPTERDEWDEFLLTLQRGYKAQAILNFKNASGDIRGILINGESERATDGRTLRLDLRELNSDEIKMENDRRLKEQMVFPQVDAVYIDALSIKEFGPWYESLRQLLQSGNLLIGDKVSVVLMTDEKTKLKLEDYRIPGVADFIYKPVDRRFLAAKAAVLISDLVASNDDNVDLSFTPADVPAKIAKLVQLNEVAEFGFQIKSSIPFREDIFLRFYSPLFLDETGDGILARCTSCNPDPNEKDKYGCFFTFFGVSDAQLKHIRNWIREDYVSKKDEAG